LLEKELYIVKQNL